MRLSGHILLLLGLLALPFVPNFATDKDSLNAKGSWQVVGAIQHEGLFPTTDVSDDRIAPREKWALIDHLSNSYLDVGVRYEHQQTNKLGFTGISAATRAELLQWPMLGYEDGFRGYGISHLHIETQFRWGAVTVGDVYGQFGSGLILRLYEDRFLGVDNALRGGKIIVLPYKGIYFEALGGKQRRYWNCYEDRAWGWNYSQDAVMGANLELNIMEWSPRMMDNGANLTLGASFVSKYQAFDTVIAKTSGDQMYYYNLPRFVGAGDIRATFNMNGWNALVEYAYKANDPNIENGFSFRPGSALLASLSYSRKGFSAIVQAKRSENMSFRSDRMLNGIAGHINHLPPFATQHTYALAALNSYATQMNGEWAFQGEVRYAWKRKTVMGGKYGTTLKLNASHIRGLNEKNWFGMTKAPYYTDVNLELNKRVAKDWYINAMLMYQTYNSQVVEGHGGIVRSGIGVVDVKWATSSNVQMRAELQYLFTRQDDGQWIFALYELSLFKQLMLSFSEQYCIGHAVTPTALEGEHYYSAMATWQHKAHRLALGYVKTYPGYNCSGGICRYVPEQQGVMVTYDFTW